jgi:hypothetical protein
MRTLALWLLASQSSLAAQSFQNFGPFMLASDGAGEFASRRFDIDVETSGLLELRYRAPHEHCASLRVHVFVDGREVAVTSPVAPDETTNYLDLGPVHSGDHRVSLQGEGIAGGCNTGRVTAWGGAGTIWTSSGDPSSEASRLPDLVLFERETVNFAGGYHHAGLVLSADARLYTYELPQARLDALPTVSDEGIAKRHWLAAKLDFQRRQVGSVPVAELEHALALARSLAQTSTYPMSRRAGAVDGEVSIDTVYLRDSGESYRRIVLAVRGEEEADLMLPQAAELRVWLDRVMSALVQARGVQEH